MQLINAHFEHVGVDNLSKYLDKFKIRPQDQVDPRAKWAIYFGEGSLENLQQLCEDLDIHGDLSSKKKCNTVRLPRPRHAIFADTRFRLSTA